MREHRRHQFNPGLSELLSGLSASRDPEPVPMPAFQDQEVVIASWTALTEPRQLYQGQAVRFRTDISIPDGIPDRLVERILLGAIVLEQLPSLGNIRPVIGEGQLFALDTAVALLVRDQDGREELGVTSAYSGLLDPMVEPSPTLLRLFSEFMTPADYEVGDAVVPKSALLTLNYTGLEPGREVVCLEKAPLDRFSSNKPTLGERPDTRVGWIAGGKLYQALVDGRTLRKSARPA